jgi:SSS family solute:Na+ symporter
VAAIGCQAFGLGGTNGVPELLWREQMMWLGLAPLDVGVMVAVLAVIVGAGVWTARAVKKETDFFVAGRRLGGWLQFCLTFGVMSDSNEAAVIGTEVYRQGASGMWIGFQALFATPFYWFTPIWFRRTRLITFADLFRDRFGSEGLAAAYSAITILIMVLSVGLGNLVAYKLAAAVLVKPASEYSAAERETMGRVEEYQALRVKRDAGGLMGPEVGRYELLESMAARNELPAAISYIRPLPFYVCYSLIVGSYLLVGGIKSVAVVDGLQGVMILTISVLLLPFGLARVGGLHGLHAELPAFMFRVFGDAKLSEYHWVSIGGIVLACIVGTPSTGGPNNASGKDERAVRIGTLSGAFGKRLIMMGWMLCGLIAAAIFKQRLADPDAAWGAMTSALLMPGFLGLMVVGMVVGHMPNVGYTSLHISALFTRNLYEPVVRGKSARHYLVAAKLSIVGAMTAAIFVALFFNGVIALLTTTMTLIAYFGAVGYLIYFWRKLTAPAIWFGMVVWMVGIGVLPWGLPQVAEFRRNASLTVQSASGVPLFFDRVATGKEGVGKEGLGRFNVENYVLWKCGVPLEGFGPAGVMAGRWYVDSVLPFVLVMGLSLLPLGRKGEGDGLREQRFFNKLRTPVAGTAERDREEVAISDAEPRRFDGEKLFPGTSWEFSKWTLGDAWGFAACWAGVGVVLGILWVVLRVR